MPGKKIRIFLPGSCFFRFFADKQTARPGAQSSGQLTMRLPSGATVMETGSVSSGKSASMFSGHSIRQRAPLSR